MLNLLLGPLKKALPLFAFLFLQESLFGQSPGGIPTNNKIWLRSDHGVTTSGSTVTLWQETSGANVTGNFNVQPLAGTQNVQTGPALIPAAINFNPYLSFDGITNSLSSINSFLGTALVGNSNVTVFQVLNVKSGVVWLKWETDFNGTTGRLGFENSTGRLRFDFPKAVPATAGQNVGVTNILNKHTLSTAYADIGTSVNRLNGADDRTITIPGPGNFGNVSAKIVLGNEDLLNLPCKIDIAEVIIYSNTLNTAERNKIESYLAVKYGFTLDQLAANNNNYVATTGAIIWDRALNSAYANDITGIGRDDATALSQKQSRSVNTTALVTLYNGTYPGGVFPTENQANTNSFPNNLSFVLTGDNGSATSIDQCTLNGSAQRMARIWKVSKTGTVAQVTVAVDQTAVPATTKNILVSADPGFPKSGTTVYPLTIANGKLFAAVMLNHNDHFTFASDTVPIPQFQSNAVCPGTASLMTITNPLAGATYNWYTTLTGGTSVATGTSYSTVLSISTTFYVETIAPFDCTISPRTPVLAQVSNLVNLKTNDDAGICSGKSFIINTVSNGTSFVWTPATGLSNPNIASPVATPTVTTQYIITATLNGCTAKDTLTITVNPSPQVNAGPDLNTLPGSPVTLQGSANTSGILWTPNFNLSSSGILNPIATPVSTTVYTLTATGNNGCIESDSMVVIVIPQCIKPINAFTPNNDGFNDLWIITNGNCLQKAKVQVYNRYGGKVYESEDYKNDWDGTYKGKPVPDGTYYYVIQYLLINNASITKKGNVTILR
ncbi:MAG: gliding motility-associated C-terminal domain-containing protein [Ferruginibacter sp.]